MMPIKLPVIFLRPKALVRERYPMVLIRDGKEEHYHSLLYVKTISDSLVQYLLLLFCHF